ncbi:hypothetical protein CCM_06225 [Cordyceps militaris CM01]|uniref:Uncharacterized protein n=1 Tax=Cordyceps militaris (strain CM01) TaxID=983644 RepID=G3JJH7_CORMM|nr:uncharacterized protein CCM_06225 [Cordyceps militaris CM01]EGX92065.1 hypothetical protein CCM_06225 [Cordyceps militaris CM01]
MPAHLYAEQQCDHQVQVTSTYRRMCNLPLILAAPGHLVTLTFLATRDDETLFPSHTLDLEPPIRSTHRQDPLLHASQTHAWRVSSGTTEPVARLKMVPYGGSVILRRHTPTLAFKGSRTPLGSVWRNEATSAQLGFIYSSVVIIPKPTRREGPPFPQSRRPPRLLAIALFTLDGGTGGPKGRKRYGSTGVTGPRGPSSAKRIMRFTAYDVFAMLYSDMQGHSAYPVN